MLKLRKTAVAVLALGSSAVFAGTMGPVCSAVNVTVPCETTAWDFGAYALYLQPSLGEAQVIGSQFTSSTTPVSGVVNYMTVDPKWSWGFKLEGSYHFNTGNDLNLNWYRVAQTTTNTFTGYTTQLFGNNISINGTGTTTVSPNWNAVNLELGQHVDFSENSKVRFHGGIAYARLATDTGITVTGVPVSSSDTVTWVANVNPTYNGFGPRLGADLSYDWGNGVGIYANGATALFAGTSSFTKNYINTNDSANLVAYTNASVSTVVPELEAKLGVTYTYAMAQGDLTLDAGWMWIDYIAPNLIPASGAGTAESSDVGLQGVFFGLKWMGNVA